VDAGDQNESGVYSCPAPMAALRVARRAASESRGQAKCWFAIRAAGLNRGELLARPLLRADNPALRPTRAGGEFAGVIEALGDGATSLNVGDRVMGRAPGSYAEYAVAQPRMLMRMPTRCHSPMRHLSGGVHHAHDAIVTNAATRPNESIMITAAPSGVGIAALQIARRIGVKTIIRNHALGRRRVLHCAIFGATDVIDVTKAGWPGAVLDRTNKRGVDVIIDSVGGPMLPDNIRVLAIKGRLVSVGRNAGNVGDCNLDEVARKRVGIIGVTFRTRTPRNLIFAVSASPADFLRRLHYRRDAPDRRQDFPVRAPRRRANIHVERRANRQDRS